MSMVSEASSTSLPLSGGVSQPGCTITWGALKNPATPQASWNLWEWDPGMNTLSSQLVPVENHCTDAVFNIESKCPALLPQ